MDISQLALWFVCGMGTVVFASVAPMSRGAALACVAALSAGAWWTRQPFAPSAPVVALAAAFGAATYLVRRPGPWLASVLSGLLAGLWIGVLTSQGIPATGAVILAAAVPSLSAYLRHRRPSFAPPALCDEALLLIVVLGVVAAAAPGIADGWRAAANLNLQGRVPDAVAAAIPAWTLAVAGAALLSGATYSLWSRR